MNFKEYDEIIEKHKYDMLFFEIYYNLTCNDDFKTFTDEEKEKLINFIHSAYLKDESYIDLGHMCDVAVEYKDKILQNNVDIFNVWDFLAECAPVF